MLFRSALEKELASLKDKSGNKNNIVTTTFKSQIPQGYDAAQLVEFEKLKFAIAGYVDFRKAQIEEVYRYEINKAKGNEVAILQAEENKNIAIAKLNSDLVEFQKSSNDKLLQDTAEYLKQDEQIRQQNQDKIKKQEAEYNRQKLDAIDDYYEGLRTKNEDYFDYKVKKAAEESAALLELTGDPIMAKQLEIDRLKELEQEYFDWKIEQWKQTEGLAVEITMGYLDLMTAAYDTFWQTLADADISGKERLEAMWQSVKSSIFSTLGEIIKGYISNWIKSGVIGDSFRTVEIAKGTAMGTALAAAYAPAATFASIMSFGGAAVAGEAALTTALATTQALAAIPKFAKGSGGYQEVPAGYPNDSYLVAMKSGEDFNVRTPSQRNADQTYLKALGSKLDILNMNLLNKNLSANTTNIISIDGKKLAITVAEIQDEIKKTGRKII